MDGLFGGGDAAEDAANAQQQSSAAAIAAQERMLDKQIAFSTESREVARGDLQPFREAGQGALTGLTDLITNPQKQKDFITSNPFFDSLATRATNTLMGNAAAKGKVGSGGTAEALQNSLLLLGNDLLNQNIGQRQNLATMGANAAAGQATTTQQTASNVTNAMGNAGQNIMDLTTGAGNAKAAGIIGAQNANANMVGNLVNTGASLWALSDIRAKEDIKPIGTLDNGIPIYSYRYIGEEEIRIGPMAQEVEEILPEAVKEHDGYKYINMERICQ